MDTIDNEIRTEWAINACATFVGETRYRDEEIEPWTAGNPDKDLVSEVVGDLMCNLLHLAASRDLSLKALVEGAFENYEAEVKDELFCEDHAEFGSADPQECPHCIEDNK